MFSDVVMLHGDSINTLPGSVIGHQAMSAEHNVCSSEKMTQTGDGNVWSTSPINHVTQVLFLITYLFIEYYIFAICWLMY